MGKYGPKTILTPALQKALVDLIGAGNYISVSCAAVGIGESTYYEWMKKAAAGDRVYTGLAEAIKKAEAKAEAAAVANIRAAGREPRNWAAEMTFLQRRYPSRWAERQELAEAVKQGISFLEEIAAAYKAPEGQVMELGAGPVVVEIPIASEATENGLAK